MATKTFTDGVEVSNGEVVDSTEINQIAENTDHLKLNYLKVGYNLDSSDVGNGYECVFVKKPFSSDISVSDNDPSSNFTAKTNATTVASDGSGRLYSVIWQDVTITLPTTSVANDAETKSNTLSNDKLVVSSAVIVAPTLTPSGSETISRYVFYASVISADNSSIVVRCGAEFVWAHDGSDMTVTFAGEVHMMIAGTY